jgi:peptidoglycan/xylan/chitin deacetylase (PgdA/CDA1 family)
VTTAHGAVAGVVAAIASTAVACGYYATYAVRSQWLGPTHWRGPGDQDGVCLTFDDGPSKDTDRILDVLARHDAPAAFFMIGRHVEHHADVARRVATAGHEIGNHSYSHPIYLYGTRRHTYAQLARTQQIVADIAGVRPAWARPPCGVRSPGYFTAAQALGLRTVQWTVAGFDWKRHDAARIASHVLRHIGPGSIILLHDGDSRDKADRRETARSLPAIIAGITARGLRLTSLESLLQTPWRDSIPSKVAHV